MRPPNPFASRPNSFADDVLQLFLYLGFLISFLYLRILPMSVSMTDKYLWMSFSSRDMVISTFDTFPL